SCLEFVEEITGQRVSPEPPGGEANPAAASVPVGSGRDSDVVQPAAPAAASPLKVDTIEATSTTQAKSEIAPHFQLVSSPSPSEVRTADLLKSFLIVFLTVVATLLLAKFVLPLLPLWSK